MPLNPDHRKKRVGVTREKAESIIADLLYRVNQINNDPEYLWAISRLAVFGSFVNSEKSKLGDIDIAVELCPKCPDPDKHWRLCAEQQQKERRGQYRYLSLVCWPETKTLRALKARRTSVSLHDFTQLRDLEKETGAKSRLLFKHPRLDRDKWFGINVGR